MIPPKVSRVPISGRGRNNRVSRVPVSRAVRGRAQNIIGYSQQPGAKSRKRQSGKNRRTGGSQMLARVIGELGVADGVSRNA